MVSSSDYSWDKASSMRQVLNGIENYRSCLHHLWPVDQTGDIIGKLQLKYRHIAVTSDQKTRVAIVTTYFNHIPRANAKRAANKVVVLSFEEHEKVLKDQDPQEHSLRGGRQPKREFPPASAGGLKICYDFNNAGCNRKKAGNDCVGQKGDMFSPICNMVDKEKKISSYG